MQTEETPATTNRKGKIGIACAWGDYTSEDYLLPRYAAAVK